VDHMNSVKAASHDHASAPPRWESGFCPLDAVVRPMLTTREAAFYLNRQPKTLIHWNHHDSGPLRPVKIRGRLAWPTELVRALVRCGSAAQLNPSAISRT
jgi:hypothetical protein